MYKAYEFNFAGEPSCMYGMFVCDIGDKQNQDYAFGNAANIVETRLSNRITPLHYGVRYHDDPLTFSIVFGSEHYLDRYQMQEISNWLTGYQDYQWLAIEQPDMDNILFRCLIKELTPISVGWLPIAFEAQVVCDCAYGYSYPWEKTYTVSGTRRVTFYNDSTIRDKLKPALTIKLNSGQTSFSVTNQTTGSVMSFSGLPAGGITILADNENCILQDGNGEYDLYEYFNFGFFDLASGDNALIFKGYGTVTISGRFLYNVGA